jgi:hypothetical protein
MEDYRDGNRDRAEEKSWVEKRHPLVPCAGSQKDESSFVGLTVAGLVIISSAA